MLTDKGRIAAHFLRAKWRERTLRGETLARFQDLRAKEIVEFARKHSSYYQNRLAPYTGDHWRDIPPIGKAEMMANFGAFNTASVGYEEAMATALRAEETRDFVPTVRGLTIGLSSGTSGHRGLFLVQPREQTAWAGVMLARGLPGLRASGYRVALFLRSNSNLYERLGSRWIQFRYFDLMTPLEEAIARFNDYRPDIVVAPPSMLGFLADARERGAVNHTPLKIFSAAEVLEPQDRARIESVFQQPLHQIYQCTEGLLAMTCARGSLHVQEDLVAMDLEPLSPDSFSQSEDMGAARPDMAFPTSQADTADRAAEEIAAQRYVPVVTDLWRTTQPIIRYRMNDIVTVKANECPCGSGFRVLSYIEGRCDDVLYFNSLSGGMRPFFPDTIRRMALLASDKILDYQAFQSEPGELRLHLLTTAGAFDEAAEAAHKTVQETIWQYGCAPARLSIERGLAEFAADAKRRRVRRICAV